jgi:hypothetical protein
VSRTSASGNDSGPSGNAKGGSPQSSEFASFGAECGCGHFGSVVQLSLLGGQRPGERRPESYPAGELSFRPDTTFVDSKPSRHRTAAHLHATGRAGGNEPVGLRWIGAYKHATLTARRDRHVPSDQEGEPAEHLLLCEVRFVGQELANAICELLVVGHRANRRDSPRPPTRSKPEGREAPGRPRRRRSRWRSARRR